MHQKIITKKFIMCKNNYFVTFVDFVESLNNRPFLSFKNSYFQK